MRYIVWVGGKKGAYGFYSHKEQPPLTLNTRENVTMFTMDGPVALPILDILPLLEKSSPLPASLLNESASQAPSLKVVLRNEGNRLGKRFLYDAHNFSGMQDAFYNGILQVDAVEDLPDGSLKLEPLFSGVITTVHLTVESLVLTAK